MEISRVYTVRIFHYDADCAKHYSTHAKGKILIQLRILCKIRETKPACIMKFKWKFHSCFLVFLFHSLVFQTLLKIEGISVVNSLLCSLCYTWVKSNKCHLNLNHIALLVIESDSQIELISACFDSTPIGKEFS